MGGTQKKKKKTKQKTKVPFDGFKKVVRVRRVPELVVEMVGSMRRNIEPNHRPTVLLLLLLLLVLGWFGNFCHFRGRVGLGLGLVIVILIVILLLFFFFLSHCFCYRHFHHWLASLVTVRLRSILLFRKRRLFFSLFFFIFFFLKVKNTFFFFFLKMKNIVSSLKFLWITFSPKFLEIFVYGS